MKLFVDIDIPLPGGTTIRHTDPVLLIGSCFTQHIGNRLADLKFTTLQNPNGILFDPHSVCSSLVSYIENKPAGPADLFFLHELWQSWQHHSQFSGMEPEDVLAGINRARQEAHAFLKKSRWLIITLGTAFSYRLQQTGEAVANCHRAPAQWFNKHLMEIDDIVDGLRTCLDSLHVLNQELRIIFTISPVRHIRDGVIENNRSKARLIEAVHQVVKNYSNTHYFPAYELVIDVLRDYRFYDIDLVHPNYAATDFVFNKFIGSYTAPELSGLIEEIKKINLAFRHKPSYPATAAHKKFLESMHARIQTLQQTYPYLDFNEEERYFAGR
ncbi:MAG: GSCFA domain-containing protein [Williamsia sp.]|nr:GSCFA domain-containing protein [Williamsia sp.]